MEAKGGAAADTGGSSGGQFGEVSQADAARDL